MAEQEPVRKSGEIQLKDSNTIRKFIFKNWKSYQAVLDPERLAIAKVPLPSRHYSLL